MKPTVGRIVHYTNLGDRDGKFPPEIQAALITKVIPRTEESPIEEGKVKVSLRIFYELGDFAMQDVPFTEDTAGTDGARGHWAWPGKVS